MLNMMTKSLEKAKARTFFAFIIYATWLLMVFQGRPVPELLETMVVAQMTFYFGTKAAKSAKDS